MMHCGEEEEFGWARKFVVDGRTIEVRANHRNTSRPPRGSEMVQQAARGRPVHNIEGKKLEWLVVLDHRRLCTIKKTDNGGYRTGIVSLYPGMSFGKVVEEIVRKHAPRIVPAALSA